MDEHAPGSRPDRWRCAPHRSGAGSGERSVTLSRVPGVPVSGPSGSSEAPSGRVRIGRSSSAGDRGLIADRDGCRGGLPLERSRGALKLDRRGCSCGSRAAIKPIATRTRNGLADAQARADRSRVRRPNSGSERYSPRTRGDNDPLTGARARRAPPQARAPCTGQERKRSSGNGLSGRTISAQLVASARRPGAVQRSASRPSP